MQIDRIWAMPNKRTFLIKPIAKLLKEEMTFGFWIDPFSGYSNLATVTNDLNPGIGAMYHLTAKDFLKIFGAKSVDGVLFDPPYSPAQAKKTYQNIGCSVMLKNLKNFHWTEHKREIARIVKVGGKVISFGWNSGGIGKKFGFEITRILLVPHGGMHYDTIVVVERKVA